jgi:8-oxo-dGTP pyrophosphatase MutT (NUDIX family)
MNNEQLAAGGVIVDKTTSTKRVLLVHRPRYDDWSFPKGKLEPGETLEEAALREVKEETALSCRIIRPLTTSRYHFRRRNKGALRPKTVHYFLLEVVDGGIFIPGQEVDSAKWFDFDEAARILTYAQDREMLSLV